MKDDKFSIRYLIPILRKLGAA